MNYENISNAYDQNQENNEKVTKDEKYLQEYGDIIKTREEKYYDDCKKNSSMSEIWPLLKTHNKIVEEYAADLSDSLHEKGEMTKEEVVVAKIATILHDSGKLNSGLLNHHKKSGQYADEILLDSDYLGKVENDMIGKTIEGVEITHATLLKVREAIKRHMNHPFLIEIKGGKFPKPKRIAEQVVFDADMLSNIGFKNVGFRIKVDSFKNEDAEVANEKNITKIQAAFDNVINGAKKLKDVVLTDDGKEKAELLIEIAEKIYNDINYSELQNELDQNSDNSTEIINNTIEKIGIKNKIDQNTIKKFKM